MPWHKVEGHEGCSSEEPWAVVADEQLAAVRRWWERLAARVEEMLGGERRVEVRTELGEAGRPIEVLRPGTFVDRFGREVVIEAGDLPALVAHFEEGAAGQEVPVDVDHEGAAAAGWVRGLYVEGGRLYARVEWTKLGRELVGERVYRYVSASIDLARKVIRSISLVNFPAVKGLAPVELASPRSAERRRDGDDVETASRGTAANEEDAMTDEERAELEAQIRAEERERAAAELAAQREQEVELRERIRSEERARLEAELAERRGLVEFAEGLCNPESGPGLSTPADEVVEALLAVPAGETRERLQRVLEGRVIEFGERGSSREGRGELRELPEAYQLGMREWVRSGQAAGEFFEVVAPELGAADEYDLSEWVSE